MAAVAPFAGGEVLVSNDELGEIRTQLSDLRGEYRTQHATLIGKIDTLAATKAGDHRRLEEALADEIYARKHTDATLAALQESLGRLPRPEWFTQLGDQLKALEDKFTEKASDHGYRIADLEDTTAEIKNNGRRLSTVEKKLDRIGFFMLGAAAAGGGAGAAIARLFIGG